MLETRKLFHQKINQRQPKQLAASGCTKAAVSLIFRPSHEERASSEKTQLEKPQDVKCVKSSFTEFDLLLMQRAYNDADPWSGQISFPGGRFEQSDTSMQTTAERETKEEIGFCLQTNDYLGQLDDVFGPIVSDKKTIHISSFFYLLEATPSVDPNHEVEQIIWMPLKGLLEANRRVHFAHPSVANVTMQGIRLDALSRDGEPLILWGLSLYLMEHLFEILELE